MNPQSSISTMAESLPKFLSSLLIFFFLCDFTVADTQAFSQDISPSALGFGREKLTHLHFYFHDVVSGPNNTVVRVAEAPTTKTSKTFFGAVNVIDDALTEGPDPNSTMVGRAQGIYASASQSELGFLMVLTFAFTEGKYSGSSLSVLGRNPILSQVREMPIVGGTGLFRYARGYSKARTYSRNAQTRDAIVEYDFYVFHY